MESMIIRPVPEHQTARLLGAVQRLGRAWPRPGPGYLSCVHLLTPVLSPELC